MLQHGSDFATYMGAKSRSEWRAHGSFWVVANEVLKGSGGLVCFCTWYFSPSLSRRGDGLEEPGPAMEEYLDLPDDSAHVDGMNPMTPRLLSFDQKANLEGSAIEAWH
jgi:hypothetical protein